MKMRSPGPEIPRSAAHITASGVCRARALKLGVGRLKRAQRVFFAAWPMSFCCHCACFATGLVLLATCGCWNKPSGVAISSDPAVMFKPEEMADAIHAVVAADRLVYVTRVVERVNSESKAVPTHLPLPSEMLRSTAQEVQKQGAEFHYVLRSLWPMNPKNGPETATEKSGLEFVASHPGSNYYSEEFLGGRRYLTAVYPDVAFSSTCTDCHNGRAQASRPGLKPGDVLGGLVVRVPLEF